METETKDIALMYVLFIRETLEALVVAQRRFTLVNNGFRSGRADGGT